MWIHKINAELTEHGFYKIPKQCLNAQFYRFEEMLKTDEKRLIKSAIVNWYYDKYKCDFNVAMNGYECIYLCKDKEIDEFYFHGYNIYNGYLINHNNQEEYYRGNFIVDRMLKINKILHHE